MKISPARTAAFDVLISIERDRAHSSSLLSEFEDKLSDKDKALCHEIVLGVLRTKLYLDEIIRVAGGDRRLDLEVSTALRMGLFQIHLLDRVPDHSAVTESVDLVQRARKTSAKGFVNAVLRRTIRDNIKLNYKDEIDRVAISTSHPRWLVERWIDEFDFEEAERIAAANNQRPRTSLRHTAKGIKADRPVPDGATASSLVPGCYFIDKITADVRELVDKGHLYIQDEASQLVASFIEVPKGGRFLDVCAAPGGKTGAIGARFEDSVGLLIAGDVNGSRVELLKENCIRQGLSSIKVVRFDAESGLPFGPETFDSILVDAPCSGTGTIRNNPEIRYSLKPEDLPRLKKKQLAILENASKSLKVGGTIVYSTCSIEKDENEDVVREFLALRSDFIVTKPKVPDVLATKDGFIRTLNYRDNMDGFFAAVLERGSGSPPKMKK